MTSPAGEKTGQPRLFRSSDGTVWMSWIAALGEGRHALRYATLSGSTWSSPATVTTGSDWFVNWADLPAVRPLPDGRIAAQYLASAGSSALAYGVRILQSNKEGTWTRPVRPHADRSPTEHGFVSMSPWAENQLLAVWLDGRKMSGAGHGTGEMTLRAAVLDSLGAVTRRFELDDRTCECCATSLVRVGGEAVVAYRDRSESEIRDISVVRFDGQTWSKPRRLHDDGWEIDGCPVNGPALGAVGDRVVAAWFTAAGGRPRVEAAVSTDGGRSFAEPVHLTDGPTAGRVDVLIHDNDAIVSWLDETEDGGVIRVRALHSDQSLGEPVVVASLPSASRSIGFPKMVRGGEYFYTTWVQPTDGSDATQVEVARLPVDRVL